MDARIIPGQGLVALDDHAKATAGVECRKDADVIDENSDGVQVHRCRDGSAAGFGGCGAHAASGSVREGIGGRCRFRHLPDRLISRLTRSSAQRITRWEWRRGKGTAFSRAAPRSQGTVIPSEVEGS